MSSPDDVARDGAKRAELVLRVARAQAGDRQALDRLLREYQEPLYRHVWSITGNRDRRLAGRQRPSPGIGTGALADDGEGAFFITCVLKTVDQRDHLPGRGVDEADIRIIEAMRSQR